MALLGLPEQPANFSAPSLPTNPAVDPSNLLNPMFVANFYPVIQSIDSSGNMSFSPSPSASIVKTLLTDGQIELSSDYASPFDSYSPESKLPTLMAMLQSGQMAASIGAIAAGASASNIVSNSLQGLSNLASTLDGKTNLTKVNSTQIFVASKPVTFSLTLLFQAWADASTEVEQPLELLGKWVLPQFLATQSILVGAAQSPSLSSLFPSKIPTYIAFSYGGKTYGPLNILNMTEPLVVPRDSDTNRLEASVTITLTSRTAIDSGDWDGSDPNAFKTKVPNF